MRGASFIFCSIRICPVIDIFIDSSPYTNSPQ
jgi:hypothetical protein